MHAHFCIHVRHSHLLACLPACLLDWRVKFKHVFQQKKKYKQNEKMSLLLATHKHNDGVYWLNLISTATRWNGKTSPRYLCAVTSKSHSFINFHRLHRSRHCFFLFWPIEIFGPFHFSMVRKIQWQFHRNFQDHKKFKSLPKISYCSFSDIDYALSALFTV